MKKSKKSKAIISTVAVLVVAVLAVVGFFVYKNGESFAENSKIGFAMGSVVTVKTFGAPSGEETAQKIIDEAQKLDKILSNKDENSLVSSLNSGKDVVFDPFEASAIEAADKIYSKTDGKATLTVGALSRLWDFDSGKNIVPGNEDVLKALKTVSENNFKIENGKASLSGGAVLDLGSIGKGLACDRAVEILNENKIENAVVAVGGSIYAKGNTAKDRKIRVGIRNPFGNENDYFAVFSTSDAFISTSGNYEKVFEKDGKTYHHLLDCTTGYPVENELSGVTVICDNGSKSDALSTACFVLGFNEKSLSLLKENSADAIFVFKDKSVKISERIKNDFTLTDEGFTVSEYEA